MNKDFINFYFNTKFTNKQLIIENLLTKLSKFNNIKDVIKLIFYFRDPKYGKGFRDKGRIMLVWLLNKYPLEFIKIIPYIPVYGRWDDIFYIINEDVFNDTKEENKIFIKKIKKKLLNVIVERLQKDKQLHNKGETISLLIKWFPSENSTKYHNIYKIIRNKLKINSKQLRKNYISPMRKQLNLIENNLSKLFYYNNVTLSNIKNYYKQILKYRNIPKPTKQSLIYKLFNNMVKNINILQLDNIKKDIFNNSISIININPNIWTSSKIPFNISVLILYLNNLNKKNYFYNKLIIYDNNIPKFIKYKKSLKDIYNDTQFLPSTNKTNYSKIFNLILFNTLKYKIKKNNQLKYLWIFGESKNNTNKEENLINIINKFLNNYNQNNIIFPHIIFYNFLNDNISINTITINLSNKITFINGYSKEILYNIFYKNILDDIDIIKEKFKKYDVDI